MPFQITDGITKVKADPTFDAFRASPRPGEATCRSLITMQSGALAGVAASNSTGTCWSLRQIDSGSVLLVRKVAIGFVCTTGYTAAQYQDFGLSFARSFSSSDSGGTAFSGASNNGELQTSFTAFTNFDLRVASTSALTAGTRTVDTNCIGQAGCYNAAGAAGGYFPLTTIFEAGPGKYPIVLAQNEGLIVWPITAMGAGGAGTLTVFIEVAQNASYS